MKKVQLTLLAIFSLFALSAEARIDPEIQESKKCSSMFSYFEKRYNLPKDTLHSVSLQETQKSHSKHKIGLVWPWTINSKGKGYHFKSKTEAITFAKAQIASGNRSIDIGCMQVNLKYHPDAFSSVEQAFSPRKNIAYAAKLLKDHYNKTKDWNKAVGLYHSGTESKAKPYRTNVSKISNSMPSYKQSLHNYTYDPKYNKNSTQKDLDKATKKRSKPKYLGLGKVEVRVGTLKDNNWFRKVQ
ncbi:lytic transglycosylase domain-containing protein [Rickettsiaceae bacterium]|nr:lytic transglycosylase domain-containing protein [Rickettsiaceae bacterium]